MTKKDFKERIDVHHYGRGRSESNVRAIFYDWKSGDKDGKYFGGFKFCIYARYANAKQEDLFNMLYDIVTGKREDTPWYIQIVIAQTDKQRFKVPLDSGGLRSLIKYEKPVTV
jgi:hypothetical protein